MNGRATPDQLAALIAEHIDYARLADEIVTRLDRPAAQSGELVTAKELARRYGHTPRWWREHKAEFAAMRDGDGPRPRLMFNPAHVERVFAGRRL